ncbi:MFS transporter [Orrella daihaiensis]|uniref:MFS transporter n=1 Tax=Orrella daihaiensis TaxID=2782176 RepID=A0ABY4AJM1_9BURK|nr:MFS transporter [Orrella daihaiensis]UOD50476.1 MFS transporter [Orrella daihaiensis]
MTHTAAHLPSKRSILLLACAAFSSTSAFRVLDPALPQLSQEFSITTGEAAKVITWFVFAYGVMQFFYGPVGDRFGKFRTLAFATLACAIGNLVAASASSFEGVLAGRAMSGATAAAIVPLSMAWIGDHVAYEDRQVTLAQFMTGTILGMSAGLVIGGALTDTLGWRWSFLFLAAMYGIVGIWLLTQLNDVPEVPPSTQGLQLVAPIVSVFALPWARIVLLVVLIEGALVFGGLSFVPAFLQKTQDMSSTMAGLITAFFGLGAMLYVLRAKWLVSRFGELKLTFAGGWVLGACYLLYLIGPHWSWAIFASVFCGLGYYLLHAVLQTNATQMAPQVRGTAVSLFASFLFLGQALGVAAGALVVDTVGIQWVLIGACAALPILGMAFSCALSKRDELTP